jgi:hypothetical protein
MTLEQIYQAIDQLTPEELGQVLAYVEQRRREVADSRANTLMQAFDSLREGLTEKQLSDIEQSINFKYIKPTDESSWKD